MLTKKMSSESVTKLPAVRGTIGPQTTFTQSLL